jgi:hypothetical protein
VLVSIHYNIKSVTEKMGGGGSERDARMHLDGVENALTAYVNLEETLPSAVYHIPSVSVLQERVTPCCDNLVLTHRKRGHFLCPCSVVHTRTQNHTTTPSNTHRTNPESNANSMDQSSLTKNHG